jgi:DNA-nicking Smr family endonuclease
VSERPLSPVEAALWDRVLETVRPLRAAPKPVAKVPAAKGSAGKLPVGTMGKAHPSLRAVPAARKEAIASSTRSLFEKLLEVGVGGKEPAKRAAARSRAASVLPTLLRKNEPANTLDGSWDKKLSRGLISPDCSIDLHGHNLSTAYATLDGALEQAIRMGDRVILLVTGKPPRPESERPHARGAIRAAVGDWLAGSRHASAIAAVRGAHPRHGGAGALYIILRRTDPNRIL